MRWCCCSRSRARSWSARPCASPSREARAQERGERTRAAASSRRSRSAPSPGCARRRRCGRSASSCRRLRSRRNRAGPRWRRAARRETPAFPACPSSAPGARAWSTMRSASHAVAANSEREFGPSAFSNRWTKSTAAFLTGFDSGQLLGDEHRRDRHVAALERLAADAQEVVVGDALGLVDEALVAALRELDLRQRAGRAGGEDVDRVGRWRRSA